MLFILIFIHFESISMLDHRIDNISSIFFSNFEDKSIRLPVFISILGAIVLPFFISFLNRNWIYIHFLDFGEIQVFPMYLEFNFIAKKTEPKIMKNLFTLLCFCFSYSFLPSLYPKQSVGFNFDIRIKLFIASLNVKLS